MGFSALPPVAAPPASRRPARPCNPPPDRPAGPTRSGRPAVRTARPTGRAPRPSIARPGKWPDRPTRTAWPLPPLSAAQFAPSSLSGSSWHPSNSSRRSAAPTPCTLSQTRSSAGTLFGKKSPPAVHAEQPIAGSHGSLFLLTSLNFDTVIILSLRARGEPGGGQSLPRRAPGDSKVSVLALCMSAQAAAGHDHRAALLQPDLSHCPQPPEHHHRPASCHGELLLHPFARLLRWHTSAFRCSRSASSSPHSCHGAVATHLLAGLSHADSTSLPLWCTPRAATAAGSRPA
mmetsp:Transcript_37024/g.116387  ORF Transcript_37024/g.116387 Transcript_37024/m.116387 type:complete len:289 (-) Transcript_37024:172-1038(-)